MQPRHQRGYLIRDARPQDARALARMMIEVFTWGRVRDLGLRFNTVLHRAWIQSRHADVVVAEKDGEIVGYSAALSDSPRFHRELKLRYGWQLGLLMLPKLLRPRNVETVLRAYTYYPEVPPDDPPAEFVSMAVDPAHRRGGIGRLIVKGLFDNLRDKSLQAVKIGNVDVANNAANGFWRDVGGRFVRTEKFYRNSEVNVYVYDLGPVEAKGRND